ncbi:polysaccharide biosynthesis tyrosine autokinase [Novipirellula artificiosorum]|uniref:Tyrosine-protein kinase YwqD n=1 Tax=Novipirellula artificiosorum TaxID=2528016 RepID=A0A5C6D2P7_9BACT|nr:tyrosine-protein kinase family protein [Novipirellula artificiosorum]TWU29129.1 Tyrosine-protein kinase YwqD [Novipirellula artificiosorum]
MNDHKATSGHAGRIAPPPLPTAVPSKSIAATSSAGQFDPWLIWHTFRRCWPWALPIGIILAGAAALAVQRTFVPEYRAQHLLEANEDYVVFQGVMPMVKDLARTETSLFFNPIVLDPVLADPENRMAPSLSDPESAEQSLQRNLSVASGGTSTRLVVSYKDTDPEAAALVCNAVVESYLRQRDSFDSTRVSNLERWLEPEIQRWEREVSDRQRVVQSLSEQTLGYSPGERVSTLEDSSSFSLMTRLRQQIAELNVEISVLDAQQAMKDSGVLVSGDPMSDSLVIPEPSEGEIASWVNADTDVVEAKSMIQRYKSIAMNMEDSDLVRIQGEYYRETLDKVKKWEQTLEESRQAARVVALEKLNELAKDQLERSRIEAKLQQQLGAQDRVASKQQTRQQLQMKLDVLNKQYEEERIRMEQFGGATAELQFAQEELAVANDVLKKLRDRVAAIRTERRQDGAVRTLAAATPPRTPIESLPVKQMAVFGGGALMIPFLLGLLWELRVRRVTDSSMCTSLAVVGEVSRLPSGPQSSRSRRVFEESIDSLRSNLFLSTEWKDTRTIAVVSSVSGEGKSSVASQLALSIAKATGNTVLLVDADLRCPDQHRLFGLEMGPGLSAVLSGKAKLSDATDKSLGDLVHLLPAGPLSSSPHRLINPDTMRAFISQALKQYKFVVVDTAPVLSAGESLAVAASVDSTLLCVMRDLSRVETVQLTTRRLQAAGATLTGTVFSGVTARQYAYRYGDYHYAVSSSEAH